MSKMHTDPYISKLHQNEEEKSIIIDKKRTQILIKKFFSTLSAIESVHNVHNLSVNSVLRLND